MLHRQPENFGMLETVWYLNLVLSIQNTKQLRFVLFTAFEQRQTSSAEALRITSFRQLRVVTDLRNVL